MNVSDYERLIASTQAINLFIFSHQAMLLHDEGHGTETAKKAIDNAFAEVSYEEDSWELADALAIRLIREATMDVCDRLEAFIEAGT
jgi:hypothetical protein